MPAHAMAALQPYPSLIFRLHMDMATTPLNIQPCSADNLCPNQSATYQLLVGPSGSLRSNCPR